MKLVSENINEAVKHLTPKSKQEIIDSMDAIGKYMHNIPMSDEEKIEVEETDIPKLINALKQLKIEFKFKWTEDDEYHFKFSKNRDFTLYFQEPNQFLLFDNSGFYTSELLLDAVSWKEVIDFLKNEFVNESIKHLTGRPSEEISKHEDEAIENWIESGNIIDGLKNHVQELYASSISDAPNPDQIMTEFLEEDGYADEGQIAEWLLHEFDKKQLMKALKDFINGFRDYINTPPINDTYYP